MADPRALGLIAVGSMADRDYGPDEWSDHDFFVITPPGVQEELRRDLSWLPCVERLVVSFRETEHGLKAIYDDGHMLEFAVFDLDELGVASLNRYRVLLDRGGVEARADEVAARPQDEPSDEYLFGMVLGCALVAGGRARRGELLTASFLVTWGLKHLTRLLVRHLPSERKALLDEFDPLRRFERAYPELGRELDAICRLPPTEGGPALLDVMERELHSVCPELPWRGVEAVRGRFA